MKNSLHIIGGVIGAVADFLATLLVLELGGFGNQADPIMSGLLALLVFAPAGALVGLVIGTWLGMRWRGRNDAGGLARNSLKAFGVVVALCAVAGGAYFWYAVSTATPWLNPNAANPILQFEVRLPAGAALPAAAQDIAIELQTDRNLMPGETRFNQFRRDGDRSVIVGDVELAFRTATRQLQVKIKGQPDRVFRIGLSGKAPHAP
ncbi:MAG: hypothetical protein Q7T45_08235 [Bradyrhizobium sp.]|uniref:hypothetical protein n=1 Tax=Bradyrhizobium sp. TaxID=376 RepID=UPI00271DAECC|nr:hypothetical protein [Bradyrhizobium sp.]MDO8397794.1 hypothetical protein [Bradyrhizobium sp.]